MNISVIFVLIVTILWLIKTGRAARIIRTISS